MELLSVSFRQQNESTAKLGGSKRSLLVSESISSECSKIASYERISVGNGENVIGKRSKKNRGWRILSKVIVSFTKNSGDVGTKKPKETSEEKKTKTKRRSAWLPDPERRWPVQGW